MAKQFTTWIKIREILIFFLIWPVLPIIVTKSRILYVFHGNIALDWLGLLYYFAGWYIGMRVYRYRTKQYVKTESISTTYSLKKEIGLFLLIWPITPILIYCINYFIWFYLGPANPLEVNLIAFMGLFSITAVFWFMFGWPLAFFIYYKRRKNYFKDHVEEKNITKNKVGKFIPLMIFLIFLGLIAFHIIGEVYRFITPSYENTSSSGATIRLKISEEECKKYPNRYYFRDLCILCPDEQPLVDGHCQRCPEGELVLSIGCNRCDRDIDYLTPKAECDACPNRVYEDGLCRLSHKTRNPNILLKNQ